MTESVVPEPHQHEPELSVDEQRALHDAALRLQSEFGDNLGAETVDRCLDSSRDRFDFQLERAERFARQHLLALARVAGDVNDSKPVVLFLCTHNAGRSQMALGYLARLAGDWAVGWSGGSAPASEINAAAVAAMAEVGIDISAEFPKPWTDEIVAAADVIVTMGCGDACPVFPGRRYLNWELPDPAGQSLDAVRGIRDEIERRIRALLADLDVAVIGTVGRTR